jgi:DNA-directed RNA polymerase I, II, and III subunit RPABC2
MSSVKLDKEEIDIPVKKDFPVKEDDEDLDYKDEDTPPPTSDESDVKKPIEETDDDDKEVEDTEDEATEDTEDEATEDDDAKNEESDEETDDEDEDFKKFEQDIKKDVLLDFHPQIKQISHKEMLTLCKIVRNKEGHIIDDLHKTVPFLTKFEKARIIGLRAKQINNGCEPFIDVPPNMIEGLTIAEKELEEKNIPFIIRRPLPNGASEYWKVSDLEIL